MEKSESTIFTWNTAGWWVAQLGGTGWMLILGLVLSRRDPVAALVSLGGFLVSNAWGAWLWTSRARISAYAALQRFLAGAWVVAAVVAAVANERGVAERPEQGQLISTYLPYWLLLTFPVGMLVLWIRERLERKARKASGPTGMEMGR